MTGRCVAVLCGAMVLGGAAPAHALTAYVDYDSLVVSAAPGEKNILTIQPDPVGSGPVSFLIVESGIAATHAGPGCEKTVRAIRCALSYDNPVASLALSLGDKNDVASVTGGYYYEQVDAGAGNDRVDLSDAGTYAFSGAWITGGAGDDELDTRNGSYDNVNCGSGDDTAKADSFDSLSSC